MGFCQLGYKTVRREQKESHLAFRISQIMTTAPVTPVLSSNDTEPWLSPEEDSLNLEESTVRGQVQPASTLAHVPGHQGQWA
jgi:hypothetical protein